MFTLFAVCCCFLGDGTPKVLLARVRQPHSLPPAAEAPTRASELGWMGRMGGATRARGDRPNSCLGQIAFLVVGCLIVLLSLLMIYVVKLLLFVYYVLPRTENVKRGAEVCVSNATARAC